MAAVATSSAESRKAQRAARVPGAVGAGLGAAARPRRRLAITLDRYGHLLPGGEEEAAALLDAFLECANTQARLVQVDGDRSERARADHGGRHGGG